VEAFVILVVAAGLSAVVVRWAMKSPTGRPRPKEPRTISIEAPIPQPVASLEEELNADGFVLTPREESEPDDERPSRALSLVRLALIITFFAALGVGVLAVLGFVLKAQLDQYFTGL
jgi:hypothetical protein